MSQDIDILLQTQSRELFSLDDLSWDIIYRIAREGPQNVYSLYKLIARSQVGSIRRRIQGSQRYVGLEKEGFLIIQRTESFRETEPKYARYYGLSFKGFLASLTDVRLGENYLFQVLIKYLNDRIPIQTIDYIIEYIKYEIAAWFQSHIENRFVLTYMKNTMSYYMKTKDIEKFFGRPGETWEPIFTDASLEPSAEISVVDHYREIYSEEWIRLTQQKMDLEVYIYETSCISIDLLDNIFRFWPFIMLQQGKLALK